MRPRIELGIAGPLAVAALLGTIPILEGWIGQRHARSQPAQPPPAAPAGKAASADASRSGQSEDERAIRAADAAFVREYNQGESKALAARFTEDAEAIEADGDRYQGRDLIERRFAETFAASPGVKIALEIQSIRFLSPDVAKEEGRSLMTPAKEVPVARPYTVLYVKRGGQWLISSVREEPDAQLSAHDRLKELDWMIGEWVDEGPDSVVHVLCRWSEDGRFLLRSFTVKLQGKPVMTVSQRIGWDPLARQIRSWDFDSEGGFGEGRWSRDDDRWIIRQTAVHPEGTPTSAINIMARERSDLVRWASTARVIGEESIPGDESFTLVRVPPPPRTQLKGVAPTTSSPNTPRSPR
jgi:uncharacterized protein (TIGR02246 family)